MNDSPYNFSFNRTDYEFKIRLFNGENSIYLKPEGFDDLYIEEDIFDWKMKGSIVINSPYDSLERESTQALELGDKKNLVYKFRGDGRDTIFISIMPKKGGPLADMIKEDFEEELWRIELEAVIHDVADNDHQNIGSKSKTLYFVEKTYQLMSEKNTEFTTSNVGANKDKKDAYRLNNEERSLKTGEALGELLATDTDFQKHAEHYIGGDKDDWDVGSDKNKIFYTSSTNNNFLDDMDYIMSNHTANDSDDNQPCLLKLERGIAAGEPKQFSLKSLKSYFKEAGKSTAGKYQIEQLFLENYSENEKNNVPIIKSPLSKDASLNLNVSAEDFSTVSTYSVLDFSGQDYASNLHNRFITSHNSKKGQFNIEIKEHKTEKYQEFFEKSIVPNILTTQTKDRLPLTKYIKNGYNSQYYYSEAYSAENRLADGRNKLISYYLFLNIGISFSLRGLTRRQAGRFFGLNRNTLNDKDFDHLIEGQYFVTNVIHHFSTKTRSYNTHTTAIKCHKYKDDNPLKSEDDADIK